MSLRCVRRVQVTARCTRQRALIASFNSFSFSARLHTSPGVRDEFKGDTTEATNVTRPHKAVDTIYLSGLPTTVKVGLVKEKLQDLGITDYREIRILNEFRKRRIAFGFIRCASPEEAKNVLEKIPKNWEIIGSKVKAEYAKTGTAVTGLPKQNKLGPNIIYLGGFDGKPIGKVDITAALKDLGLQGPWHVTMPKGPDADANYVARFAFLCFNSANDASIAYRYIRNNGGLYVRGVPLVLSIYKTKPKQTKEVQSKSPPDLTPLGIRTPSSVLTVRFVRAAERDATAESEVQTPSQLTAEVRALLGSDIPTSIDEVPSAPAPAAGESDTELGLKPNAGPVPGVELRIKFGSPSDAIWAHGKLNGANTPGGLMVVTRFYRDDTSTGDKN